MNTIVAESLDYFATRLETADRAATRRSSTRPCRSCSNEIINEHGAIIFNGDGYSEEWHAEAEKRGLPNLKTAVDALPVLGSKEVKALFEKYGVLSERELHSRFEIYLEQYCKTVDVEAEPTIEMAKTMIFPAAIRYQSELAVDLREPEGCGLRVRHRHARQDDGAGEGSAGQASPARSGHGGTRRARQARARRRTSATTCCRRWRRCARHADELEGMVADDLWPLPTYQEMLFIK